MVGFNEEILQKEEISVSLSLYFSEIFNHAQPDPRSGNRIRYPQSIGNSYWINSKSYYCSTIWLWFIFNLQIARRETCLKIRYNIYCILSCHSHSLCPGDKDFYLTFHNNEWWAV